MGFKRKKLEDELRTAIEAVKVAAYRNAEVLDMVEDLAEKGAE